MNDARYFEHQRERAESEAEARAERVERYAQDLMQRDKQCYPWSSVAISEAFEQADTADYMALQEAAESHDWAEFGAISSGIVRKYWEGIATYVAERSPQVDGPDDSDD